jgi:hypothetical protein
MGILDCITDYNRLYKPTIPGMSWDTELIWPWWPRDWMIQNRSWLILQPYNPTVPCETCSGCCCYNIPLQQSQSMAPLKYRLALAILAQMWTCLALECLVVQHKYHKKNRFSWENDDRTDNNPIPRQRLVGFAQTIVFLPSFISFQAVRSVFASSFACFTPM